MPDIHPAPPPIFASGLNARPWSGAPVFHRGGDPVTLPAYGEGEGEHRCALDFLTGYGVAQSVNDDLGESGVSVSINADDRIVITNAAGGAAALVAHADNAFWGLPTTVNVGIPAGTSYTAPREWKRGPLTNGLLTAPPRFRMQLPGFGFTLGFPTWPAWGQGVPAGLRTRGAVGDIDDSTGLSALEELDNAINDDANARIRWSIIGGRVAWSAAAAIPAITWLDEAFRDRLGFDGTEPLLDTAGNGGVGAPPAGHARYQIANKRLPGWIAPSRPLSRQDRRVEVVGDDIRLTDGGYSSVHTGSYYGWEIDTRLDGPLDAMGDITGAWLDLHAEWARPGMPLTLYQGLDTRRGGTPEAPTAAYDLLHTAEPYRGRLLCSVHPDTRRVHAIRWEGRYRRRAAASIVLADREAGV